MSDLLNQASLVMVPSGYKEDTVYSVVPSDGSGDLSFTRASNGTRVNSAGLVEVAPWNLLQYSEDFANAFWSKDAGATVDSNVATAPNGTTTADRLNFAGAGQAVYTIQTFSGANTFSVYLKGEGANIGKQIYLEVGVTSTVTLTGEWQRFEVNADNAGSVAIKRNTSGQASSVLAWGVQVNAGTLKPYFPTTDRLNVPRLTYQNGGGGCPSLLLEKQSTNVLTYSEDFSNAVYTKRNSTIGSNVTTSPDGTTNADKIQEDTSNDRHDIYTGFACTNGVTYTQTIFAKQGERRYCFMTFGTALINPNDSFFDLQDGVVVSSPSGVTSSIENMGNGWFRCRITATCSGNGTAYFVNGPAITSSNYIYQGVSGYGIYIWGSQIEASSYPTSYIPTTSSSATRVADACYKGSISSLIGATEGVLFVDFIKPPTGTQRTKITRLSALLTDGGNSFVNSINLDLETNGNLRGNIVTGGTSQVDIQTAAYAAGTRIKMALAYKANDCVLYINGTQIGTDTSASIPVCTAYEIGSYETVSATQTNYISQAVIFKTRLTNAELASITTI